MNTKKIKIRNNISTLVFVLLVFAICIFIQEGNSRSWTSIISKILIFSLGAISLNIVTGLLGEFSLGHGGFMLIGYTSSVLLFKAFYSKFEATVFRELFYSPRGGIEPLGYIVIVVISIIAAVITSVFGLLVGIIILGRMKGDYLAIGTLGIALIFVTICKNFPALGGTVGFGVTTQMQGTPILFAVMLALSILVIMLFMKSRFGRGILAIRDDNVAAEACGIPVKKYKVMAFTISTFFAGLAGSLYAFYITLAPMKFNTDLSIELLIIVVLGGLGSLTGTGIASIVIVIYNLWFCNQSWVPKFFANNPKIIYGVVLVVIMLFRPSGILSNKEFSWNWFYRTKKKKLVNECLIEEHINQEEVDNTDSKEEEDG